VQIKTAAVVPTPLNQRSNSFVMVYVGYSLSTIGRKARAVVEAKGDLQHP
jgi:hypothetical protein